MTCQRAVGQVHELFLRQLELPRHQGDHVVAQRLVLLALDVFVKMRGFDIISLQGRDPSR
jgi:hypothetical protein